MTSVLHSLPTPPPFHHHHTHTHYHHLMQSTPFRSKMIPPRSPPMPPSLIDSPFVHSPNSPYRRDHSISPSAPAAATNHDRLNLRDTVPVPGSKALPHEFDPEPTPDDIGVAGTPKSARSSSIATRSIPVRPNLARGSSWYLQQQAMQMQQRGSSSNSSSSSSSAKPMPAPSPMPPTSSSTSTSTSTGAGGAPGTTLFSAARP